MKPRFAVGCAVLCFCFTASAFSQDAVKVDPAHYKVESENARVRILRIHYGAGEKSVMHSHPDSVVVMLSEGKIKFTRPDGKTEDMSMTTGQAMFTPAGTHLPENTGDKAFDAILVELKGGKAKAAAKASAPK